MKLFIDQQVVNLPTKSIIKKLGTQPSVLQQDNTSNIRLEANGKRSSTKKNSTYQHQILYVTNKIKSGDVVIVYHPTDKMVGDFLTKPLNGTPFKNHRNTIMGVDEDTIKYSKTKYNLDSV